MRQIINDLKEIDNCKENTIILNDRASFIMENTRIVFAGKNNILYVEGGVKLSNSSINFNADNSVVFLSKSDNDYKIKIEIYNNSTCYLGRNCYFNGALNIVCAERKNVFLGNNSVFSFGIWIRTADGHLIYSEKSRTRINSSKSVIVGDHVWIGQNVTILKGSKVHSGSIIGGGAVLTGKEVPSNVILAGNPAKIISKNIFWSNPCVNMWCEKDTEESKNYDGKCDFSYYSQRDTIDLKKLDEDLTNKKNPEEKLKYLLSLPNKKNRFSLRKRSLHKKLFNTKTI